jgi:hypothetical protein
VTRPISFGGHATGHIMTWSTHGDRPAANVWAIPADVLQAGLAVLLICRLYSSSARAAVHRLTEMTPVRREDEQETADRERDPRDNHPCGVGER